MALSSNYPPQEQHRVQLDREGDTIMVDLSGPSTSLPKDEAKFDWSDFRLEKPSQNTSASPASSSSNSSTVLSPSSRKSGSSLPNSPIKSSTLKSLSSIQEASNAFKVVYPAPPSKPLTWVWQCHMCRSRYPLAVTRRCLIDGHYYCSGDSSNQRNVKRRKKAQSCTSEFDYVGWQEWGQWVRKCMALKSLTAKAATRPPVLHGCQGCSFPSQCRYDSRSSIEKIELRKYVKESDLIWKHNESNERDTHAPETIQPVQPASSHVSSLVEPSVDSLSGSRSNKLKKGRKYTDVKLDIKSLTDNLHSSKQPRRQRFYSSFSGSNRLASPESSPTSEPSSSSSFSIAPGSVLVNPSERGKFDPSLPSIFAKKQRTNSKPNDPEFTVSPSAILFAMTDTSDLASSLSSDSPLTRTMSRQNLPTLTVDATDTRNSLLLRLDGPKQKGEEGSQTITQPSIVQGSDFEDILLSPSTNSSSSPGDGSIREEITQRIQQQPPPAPSAGERISLLFPIFGFNGRR